MTNYTMTAAIIICPIPRQTSVTEAAAWMAEARSSDVPMTWTVNLKTLATAREAAFDSLPDVALDLSADWPPSRQVLRQAIREARQVWPQLTSIIARGSVRLDLRDALVQEGINTIVVDQFDFQHRGSRRPAPRGWPCRSMVWGLWEVALRTTSGFSLLDHWVRWRCRGHQAGSLHILDAGESSTSPATVHRRFKRHLAWIRRETPHRVQALPLSELPAILRGGIGSSSRGSILRAA
ncbi:MAG: hypothetical protein O3A37_07650 [Planctomycetota bacterium]|jgi:hypothetical protein|nr:hypothetical protein [Planctomycetota bacterium]